MPLVLPIGMDNPVERVYEVRRRMAALKGSYQPLLAFSLLAVAGLLLVITGFMNFTFTLALHAAAANVTRK